MFAPSHTSSYICTNFFQPSTRRRIPYHALSRYPGPTHHTSASSTTASSTTASSTTASSTTASFTTASSTAATMPPFATAHHEKPTELYMHNLDELDSDLFEQFISFSPSNDMSSHEGMPGSTFGRSSHRTQITETSSDSLHDAKHVEDDWQTDQWLFAQDSATPQKQDGTEDNMFYAELSGRAAISDSDLLSLEDISLQSPHVDPWSHPSLPSTPIPAASRKKSRIDALANTLKKASKSTEKILRSPIRKSDTTPKIRGASNNGKIGRDAMASKFGFDIHQPLSPPKSARASDASEHSSDNAQRSDGIEDLWDLPQPLQFPTVPADYDTPQTTPNLDDTKVTPNKRFSQVSSNSTAYPMTPKSQQVSATWSHMPGSSNLSSRRASEYPVDVQNEGNPLWWNHTATTPIAQTSPNTFHRNPQRATKSLSYHMQNGMSYTHNQNQVDMSSGGLMISIPESIPQQSYVVESPNMVHQGYYHTGRHGGPPHRHSYPAPRPRYTHHPSASSPRKAQHGGPRARKPHFSTDSESPSPKSSPAFHVKKQRKSKSKNGSPRTPMLSGGSVDFVNYTPEDSRKILTGVAPSGSSKTKARREKEAMEKRRKLSQAAVKAIRAAGGDVGTLVEEGLFA